MKTWVAEVDLGLNLTEDQLKKDPEYYAEYFKDVNNPTEEEVAAYFEQRLQYWAESNDGSERLASAAVTVRVV